LSKEGILMASYTRRKFSRKKIKELPAFDRPREKMVSRGPRSLSNLELIAALVGSGTKGRDVFTVAKEIAKVFERDFQGLTVDKLLDIDGVGSARACQIAAAVELTRRFLVREIFPVKRSRDILPMVEELRDKKQEYFISLTLDGSHHLIERRTVFIGTLTKSLIHPREIFADAITDRAAAVIFVHNHPGPACYPSQNDIIINDRLVDVAEMMGIEVLDHIIINKTDTYSFKDNGLIRPQNGDVCYIRTR